MYWPKYNLISILTLYYYGWYLYLMLFMIADTLKNAHVISKDRFKNCWIEHIAARLKSRPSGTACFLHFVNPLSQIISLYQCCAMPGRFSCNILQSYPIKELPVRHVRGHQYTRGKSSDSCTEEVNVWWKKWQSVIITSWTSPITKGFHSVPTHLSWVILHPDGDDAAVTFQAPACFLKHGYLCSSHIYKDSILNPAYINNNSRKRLYSSWIQIRKPCMFSKDEWLVLIWSSFI